MRGFARGWDRGFRITGLLGCIRAKGELRLCVSSVLAVASIPVLNAVLELYTGEFHFLWSEMLERFDWLT